jgi:dTMP kinase
MKKGPFITFEGLDGSGKSTQVSMLCEWLFERNIEFVRTREPGGTELGKSIRKLVLDPPEPISAMAEAFLFAADRAQHFSHLIVPKLKAGTLVISDRCLDSNIAYQGYIRGVGASFVEHISRSCMQLIDPSITILLDMPAELVAQRKQHEDASRFDSMPLDTHQRLRAAYLALAKSEPRRIKIIDATKPVDEVHILILSLIEPLLNIK